MPNRWAISFIGMPSRRNWRIRRTLSSVSTALACWDPFGPVPGRLEPRLAPGFLGKYSSSVLVICPQSRHLAQRWRPSVRCSVLTTRVSPSQKRHGKPMDYAIDPSMMSSPVSE